MKTKRSNIIIYNHQTFEELKDMLPEGEWQQEDDLVEFIYKDYKCEIKRTRMGNLCGYVYIPEDHPLYEKIKMDDNEIECHGGITYTSEFGEIGKIGFDCAHCYDLIPYRSDYVNSLLSMFEKYRLPTITYKNIDYVMDECCSIVDQLKEKQNDIRIKTIY